MRQVEEALARQVIYGGDLITNLMEVTLIDERALLPLLADSIGCRPHLPESCPFPRTRSGACASRCGDRVRGAAAFVRRATLVIVAVADRLSDVKGARSRRRAGSGGRPASGPAVANPSGDWTEIWRPGGTAPRALGGDDSTERLLRRRRVYPGAAVPPAGRSAAPRIEHDALRRRANRSRTRGPAGPDHRFRRRGFNGPESHSWNVQHLDGPGQRRTPSKPTPAADPGRDRGAPPSRTSRPATREAVTIPSSRVAGEAL